MRKQMHALPNEFYAKVVRLRSGGLQTYEIASRLNEPEAKVRKALDFMVERYRDALTLRGKAVFVEQAMAIEVTMTQLSSLFKEATRPEVKIQAIRAREEMRDRWLDLLAQAGILDAKPTTAFHVTQNLTDEEKRRFIRIGYKRIKQMEAAQAVEGKESRLPEGVEAAEGVEEDDSGPDKIH